MRKNLCHGSSLNVKWENLPSSVQFCSLSGVFICWLIDGYLLPSMRVPPLIRTMDEVREKLDLLKALDDIEFAVRVLKQEQNTSENILDTHYRQLKCDIHPLGEEEPMYDVSVCAVFFLFFLFSLQCRNLSGTRVSYSVFKINSTDLLYCQFFPKLPIQIDDWGCNIQFCWFNTTFIIVPDITFVRPTNQSCLEHLTNKWAPCSSCFYLPDTASLPANQPWVYSQLVYAGIVGYI